MVGCAAMNDCGPISDMRPISNPTTAKMVESRGQDGENSGITVFADVSQKLLTAARIANERGASFF